MEFYEKVSPVFGGKKYQIPPPTLCADCRRKRRLSWRNEGKLYKNTCSISWQEIVSIYSPNKKFIIYNQDYWWSDKWDAINYGRDFDFSKTFFEQFKELQAVFPRIALLNGFQENTEYANHAYHNKNSYLVNACWYAEDSYYCTKGIYLNDCMDGYNVQHCNNSYELIDSNKCDSCYFLLNCDSCFNSILCENCIDCKNCIWCKWLSHKEYHIFNKRVSKDEFERKYSDFFTDHLKKNVIISEYKKIQLDVPSKWENNRNSEGLYFSDFCINCSNVKHSFECLDSENIAYSSLLISWWAKDCYDYDVWWEIASVIYETHCTGWSTSHIFFCNTIWWWHHLMYSDILLSNASYCFGCIGLHNNEQYCILNKQYTKEEYETLVPRIIEKMRKDGEYGEFFPSSLSPFGYNETVAQEYYPLTKSEAIKDGVFSWSDYESPFPTVEKIIPGSKLPDSIESIPDDILNWAIECEVTKKPFRIIKQELEFYRKHNLPIPRRHPDQRYLDRMSLRNPRKLFERKCDKCGKDMITTYAPERTEMVYCEECYNKVIY